MNRRRFVRTTAATAAGVSLAGRGAAELDPFGPQPEHVSLTFDKSRLKQYRPSVVIRDLDVTPTELYAWVAESPEFDTDVYCYWARYEGQLDTTGLASHRGDREPIYVFADSETGEVKAAAVDGYHYLVARYEGAAVPLASDSETTRWRAINPYHFYTSTEESGADLPLGDLTDQYPLWIENGWPVQRRAVVVPWVMRNSRETWWRDESVSGVSINGFLYSLYLALELQGADKADRRAL